MFIGEYNHLIDQKKRLSVPVKFREKLGGRAVITKGLDACLFLYTYEEWEKLAEKLSALPLSRADARGFARIMLAGAMEVSLDRLGRILIPDYLKAYAQLDKKVTIAGLFSRVEIWDEKAWHAYKERTQEDADGIAERLQELGI